MNGICWRLSDIVSRMLEPGERDAVLGDFAESGETGRQALCGLLGLVVRRQAALWKGWRPWLAFVGLGAPIGLLIGLFSRHVAAGSAVISWMYLDNWTWTYVTNAGARLDLVRNSAAIFNEYVTVICWSWASGFALGSLSRRAIPISGALFCLVVLLAETVQEPARLYNEHGDPNSAVFSLTFYRLIFPLILLAFLVLLPAVWGMRQGLQLTPFPLLLRAILWTFAIVTIAALTSRNWGWYPCRFGRFQACREWALQAGLSRQAGVPEIRPIPMLPFALAGPAGYLLATAVWRRWGSAWKENHT